MIGKRSRKERRKGESKGGRERIGNRRNELMGL